MTLFDKLRALGIVPVLTNAGLALRGPREVLTPEFQESLRPHKAELTAMLTRPTAPCKCGCLWYWRAEWSPWRCWACDFWQIPVHPADPLESYCVPAPEERGVNAA